MKVRVVYKDKRHSSGVIRDGEAVLYISSRLPQAERRRHIEILTRRLERRAARPRPLALELPSGAVADDSALGELARRLNELNYGFSFRSIRFKDQRSRWGSCSRRTQNIYISRRLAGAPEELLVYVVVHELCHLKEPNHGPRFWKLVERACPGYAERRRRLRQWGQPAD